MRRAFLRKTKHWVLVLSCIAFPLSALQRSQFEGWSLQGLELMEKDGRTIMQISGSRSGPSRDLLFLGFDQETPAFLRDLSGNFRIQKSEYVRMEDSRGGPASALFNRRQSGVILESPPELWPGSGPMDSFQISFYFKAAHLYRRNELFSRVGYLDGYRRGMEVLIEDGFLQVDLTNLFYDLDQNGHSFVLRSSRRIRLNEWYLFYFSYDASSGRMALYLNGQEQEVEFARQDGQVLKAINPAMDRSPLKLAGHYSGGMDEFRISALSDPESMAPYDPATYDPYSGRIYQKRSTGLSPVASHSSPLSALMLSYSGKEPPGSMLQVQYRISEEPFSASTSEHELPFRNLKKDLRLDWNGPAYMQWKVQMQAAPSGTESPALTDLTLRFRPVAIPSRPTGLRVVRELSGPSSLCLEWNRNPESSIEEKGGYIVHIGPHSRSYVALLQFTGNKEPIRSREMDFPLTEQEKRQARVRPDAIRRLKQQKVRLVVDRSLMEQNRRWMNRREAYPYLETGRAYYLSVSAYVHPDAPSEPSTEVVQVLR